MCALWFRDVAGADPLGLCMLKMEGAKEAELMYYVNAFKTSRSGVGR